LFGSLTILELHWTGGHNTSQANGFLAEKHIATGASPVVFRLETSANTLSQVVKASISMFQKGVLVLDILLFDISLITSSGTVGTRITHLVNHIYAEQTDCLVPFFTLNIIVHVFALILLISTCSFTVIAVLF
ncbi:hypothetical protein ACJX0J_015337, partial [Zea mays]